jgi:hypothetical protein
VTGVRVDAPAVKKAMQDEIARSMSDLRMGDEPRPYYLAYTLSDLEQATVSATFGALTADHGYRGRVLRTELRVGDPSFDNTNFEGGAHVETVPLEDDYPALRRELWLRTDEAYKTALETLARKRAAAAGQMDEEEKGGVGDFSKETPAHHEGAVPDGGAGKVDPAGLRDTVVRLSALFREFPKLTSSRVSATWSVVRRRLATSEGTWVDDATHVARIEVAADTQADDGMKLRSFIPFAALDPAGLPPFADMEKAVRAMATELVAMRTAPMVETGAGAVLFEGLAAAQITKLLLGDQLAGTPPPKTASAGSDDGSEQGALSNKLGQKVASPLLSAADDPLLQAGGAGKAGGLGPIFGAYSVDDEGVAARRVSLIEHGVLKGLLMTRTPRKEIDHSNGHGRAARFASTRARVGTLVLTGQGAARRPRQDRQGRRRHHVRRASHRRRPAPGRRGRRHHVDVLVRRGQPRPPAGAHAGRLPRLRRQGGAGPGPHPREPDVALAQGRDRRGQGPRRLQLPRGRPRLLGRPVDDHRALPAGVGRRHPPPARQEPEAAALLGPRLHDGDARRRALIRGRARPRRRVHLDAKPEGPSPFALVPAARSCAGRGIR